MSQQCCESYQWEFLADASHAEGCEFTYGKCRACGSHLINLCHTAVNEQDNNIKVSNQFIEPLLRLEGAELKEYMRNWYIAL